MLGKTANGLFWMYRSLERAENASRLVETGQRIALTRLRASEDEWRSILATAGMSNGFDGSHDALTKEAAINWMLRDKQNPSSVLSSIATARQNARLVRTAITPEVWEATNSTYMTARDLLARRVGERDLPHVLGTIRQRTALVRGATHGTMLRNDIYDFARIGTFLERADNTARILDVKYYVLLPSVSSVGSSTDNVQWETILRAVSARGGFQMAYGNTISAKDIAQFLILDGRMPRSLAFCVHKIRDNLGYLADSYAERSKAWDMAQDIDRAYLSNTIDSIFDYGLHEFLQKFLGLVAELGHQIEVDYRFHA